MKEGILQRNDEMNPYFKKKRKSSMLALRMVEFYLFTFSRVLLRSQNKISNPVKNRMLIHPRQREGLRVSDKMM